MERFGWRSDAATAHADATSQAADADALCLADADAVLLRLWLLMMMRCLLLLMMRLWLLIICKRPPVCKGRFTKGGLNEAA